MAIVHHWEQQGLHTQYLGTTSAKELTHSVLELSGHPRFDQLKYAIGDWSQAERGDISAEELEDFTHFIKVLSKTNPHLLNPSIMPKDENGQALVNYYVSLTRNLSWNTCWFETLEEARSWIDQQLNKAKTPA